jgi:hypothetical protein
VGLTVLAFKPLFLPLFDFETICQTENLSPSSPPFFTVGLINLPNLSGFFSAFASGDANVTECQLVVVGILFLL